MDSKEIRNTKFKNVEFLRFIFALLIVAYHAQNGYFIIIPDWLSGIKFDSVCVDLFFIIAGFFLFRNYDIHKDTVEFVKKRILRLAPNLWLLVFLVMISSFFVKDIHFKLTDNLLRLFLLGPIGFGPPSGSVGTIIIWFIPALFWVSLFYFYIAKIFEKRKLNLLIWLLVAGCYAFYLQFTNFMPCGNVKNIYYIFNVGIIRATASIGLGYFVAMVYNSGFLHKCSAKEKYIISIIEVYLCFFLIHYLIFAQKLPGRTAFLFIVMFTIMFYLFLVKQGFISKLFENNLSLELGKYSYAIYCIHPLILALFKFTYAKYHKVYVSSHSLEMLICLIFICLIAGILVYYFYEKPINQYCQSHFLSNNKS